MNKKHFYAAVILLLFLTVGTKTTRAIDIPTDISVGTWDGSTYTLTTNVSEGLVIVQDDLILDGAGHTVTASGGTGVHLFQRSYVTIKNLNVTGSYYGIYLHDSSNNTLTDNTFNSNKEYGIQLTGTGSGSRSNILKNNTVSKSNYGISLSNISIENIIYNNNFIDNTNQVSVSSSPNYFDFEGGGNYWDDYTGLDNGTGEGRIAGDGIGDTLLPHLGVDWYPFMFENGWLSPELLIEELIVKVGEINGENGINNSLDAKLQNALDALTAKNAGQRQDAVNKMQAFINAVEAQRDNKIPGGIADDLIADANYIISLL